MKPVVYLAGAIRNSHVEEDSEWREWAIQAFGDRAVILNPLAGKEFYPKNRDWTLHGRRVSSRCIVGHDFYAVDSANLIIFNFMALAGGYPMIGTLTEWGRSTARHVLRYTILPEKYTGHDKIGLYGLHPFLHEPSDMIFESIGECLVFASAHLDVIAGTSPNFGGIIRYKEEEVNVSSKS